MYWPISGRWSGSTNHRCNSRRTNTRDPSKRPPFRSAPSACYGTLRRLDQEERSRVMHRRRLWSCPVILSIAPLLIVLVVGWVGSPASVESVLAAQTDKKTKSKTLKASPAVSAVQMYVEAVASGDRVAAGLLDFACQFKMVTASPSRLKTFPPASDPVYSQCWDQLVSTHQRAVEQREQGVYVMWPGRGARVFFTEDLASYAPSFFV